MAKKVAYGVGDIVTIIDEPLRGCHFGWGEDMTDYCGRQAKIVSKLSSNSVYGYRLDVDGGRFTWPSSCFQESYPELCMELPAADDGAVLDLLGLR